MNRKFREALLILIACLVENEFIEEEDESVSFQFVCAL